MMTPNTYLTRFLPIAITLLALHVVVVFLDWIPVSFRMTLISDIVLFFIFVLGVPIVLKGLTTAENGFVGSFLIVTTIQMLSVMSVLAAFVYKKIPGFREVSLQMVSVFVVILIIQSYFLIRIVNNSNKKTNS